MTLQSSLSTALSSWTASLRLESIPHEVQEKARSCLLDWLGAAYSGAVHPTAEHYVSLALAMGGNGPARIIGRRETSTVPFAIFANGALGHISETDDGHRSSIMHPGAVVFPVVVALAAQTADPGRAVIEGAVAGYEAAIRVGEALGADHYAIWHTTATAGVFGAAAAAAKMLGCDARQTAWAMGHAGTQSAGLWQFLEDGCVSAKPFHPGKACFDGYMAAMAAERGIPGALRIFEGGKGLFAALARPLEPERLLLGLGEGYKISEANFKGYPTCGQTHSMIDALDGLCAEHHLTADSVSAIVARVYKRAVQVAGNTDPQTLEEAKFSIPYCLAYRLLHGAVPFSGLTLESVFDPAVRALMAKVRLVVDPEMDAGFPAARPCVIEITTTEGKTFARHNKYRKGDPENPMGFDQVAEKFRDLAAPALDGPAMESLITHVASLPGTATGQPPSPYSAVWL